MEVDAPFDESQEALRKKGSGSMISLAQLSRYRTQLPKYHSLNDVASYTCECFLHAVNASPLIVKLSLLAENIELARQAIQAGKEFRYFRTPRVDLYERYLAIAEADKQNKTPAKRRVLILPSWEDFAVSREENPEIFEGLFGEEGEDYLKFIGLDRIFIHSPYTKTNFDIQEGDDTFIAQIVLHRLVRDSGVIGESFFGDYEYYVRVRGLCTPSSKI